MRFGRLTTRCFGALSIASAVGGCHEYVPVRRGVPAPSGVLRVALTDAGTAAVVPVLGPRAAVLEGRWVSQTDSALVISVTQVRRIDGSEQTLGGEPVTLAATSVGEVGVVRTAVTRSVLLAGGIVAAAVIVAASIGRGNGVGGGGGGGTQQPGQ